ncbi:MAG TPA: MFS transporter [Methanobacterium sp.]|nr:MFS transporter [Methanobacterium sp.]
MIFILGLAGFISAADNWIVSPVLPAIAATFGISIALAGAVLTAYLVPYGLMQPFYGFLSDNRGKTRVLQKITLGLALGTGACAVANSFGMLFFWRAFTGFFAAGIISVSLAWIGDNVPSGERQRYVGKFMGIVFLGQGLSVGLGGTITNYISWQVMFGIFAIVSFCTVFLLGKLPETRISTDKQPFKIINFFSEVKKVVSTPKGKVIFPMAFAMGFLVVGLYSYLGAFLHEFTGLNYMQIGLIVMFYGFACLIAGSTVGKLEKPIGQKKVIICGGFLALISALILVFLPFWQAVLVATITLGFGYIFIQSPLATMAFDVTPETTGLPSALIGLGLFGGGGIGTAVFGWVLQFGGYEILWPVVALGIVLFILAAVKIDFM